MKNIIAVKETNKYEGENKHAGYPLNCRTEPKMIVKNNTWYDSLCDN